jgi:LPXTG-motif cell wall-anchored protein
VVKAPEPKPVPKVIIKQPTASKLTPTTYIDQTKNPLRGDARLLATVTVSLANPTVQDILNRFGKATDRTFTTQDDVDRATPIFAAINWVNVPVWSAMDQLARTSMTDGRWVQTADGYRLEGTSRLLRTPAASYAWVWWSVLAGGLLLGAGAVVLYRKRRAKPALAKG